MTRPSQIHRSTASPPATCWRSATRSYQIHSLAGLDIAALPVQPAGRPGEPAAPRGRRTGSRATRSSSSSTGAGPDHDAGARPEPVADLPARHQRRPDARRPRGDAVRHGRARRGPGAGQPADPRRAGDRPLGHRRRVRRPRRFRHATSRSSTAATPSATGSSSGASRRSRTSQSSRRAPGSCTRSTSSTWPESSRPRRAGRSRTSASAPTPTRPWSTASASSAGGSGESRPRPSCSASPSRCGCPESSGSACTASSRRRHRHRPGAHDHRDAAPARRGRQVRRVLRPRRLGHHPARPADHREHEPGVRLDLRLLPDRRRDPALPEVHRSARGDRRPRRGIRPAPGAVVRPGPRAALLRARRARPRHRRTRRWPVPAGPRTGSCSPTPSATSARVLPDILGLDAADDGVTSKADEASAESFPASDPPALDEDSPEPARGSDHAARRRRLPERPHRAGRRDAGRQPHTRSTTAASPSRPSPRAPTPPTPR